MKQRMIMKTCTGIWMVCVALGFTLTGCATPGAHHKAALGGAGGAAAGGLLAATFHGGATGIAAGTILGGLVGMFTGDALDAADRAAQRLTIQQTLEYAPIGQHMAWQNPRTQHRGYIQSGRVYQNDTVQYCREYQSVVIIDGREQKSFGRACRGPDGSWEIR